MVSITIALLVATIASAAVVPRDFKSTMSHLDIVNFDTKTLVSTVQSYTGGFFSAIPIEQHYTILNSHVESALNDVTGSNSIDAKEADIVIKHIRDTLEGTTANMATLLQQKKAMIASSGFQNDVTEAIMKLQGSLHLYGKAIAKKIPLEKRDEAKGAIKRIENELAKVVRSYT